MTHTPGPWKVTLNYVSQRWIEADNKNVALCPGEDDTASANAHLIAAAPDMLMLLKKSHAWFHANYSYIFEDAETMRLYGDIESEIAKAEGGK